MRHVFLIGAKSLGAYGGYETFVNKLTEYHQTNNNIKYYVACKKNGQGASIPENVEVRPDGTYTYHNADCFQIKIPEFLGSAQAIYYDLAALNKCISIIKAQKIETPIIYIMTCRIGPFFKKYVKEIHRLGGRIFLNPDGHEWLRAKWNKLIRAYWKKSEELMVKQSDLIICDSINIEKYIKENYKVNNTTYIAYGTELRKSIGAEDRYLKWLEVNKIKDGEYYLVVGRLVPENNFEIMISEFMKSSSKKDLVLITDINNKYYKKLENKTNFKKDNRIKFVGTVYNQELLMKIREQAYGYIHGHSVGGTNPSLIEALGSTKLNLLYKVGFNEEVALDSALYWTKNEGNLAKLIDAVDSFSDEKISEYGQKAKKRIKDEYSWEFICGKYSTVFR